MPYFQGLLTSNAIIYIIKCKDVAMTTTHYNSLYILDIDALDEDEQNNLLMCSSQNWEHYFSVNSEEANIETLLNVSIIEFENKHDFESYAKINEVLDFSLEHEKPMVLVHG